MYFVLLKFSRGEKLRYLVQFKDSLLYIYIWVILDKRSFYMGDEKAWLHISEAINKVPKYHVHPTCVDVSSC